MKVITPEQKEGLIGRSNETNKIMKTMMNLIKRAARAYFKATAENGWVTCPSGMIPYNYNNM